MRRPTKIGAMGLLAVLAACSVPGRSQGRDEVAYHRVKIDQAAVPARYAAAWPSTLAELKTWHEAESALPPNHAVEGLLSGDPELFGRLQLASNAVRPGERAAWVRLMHQRFEFKTIRPAFCGKALPVLEGPPSVMREVLAKAFAEGCARASEPLLILRADTPPAAVIAFFSSRWDSDAAPLPAYDPRFEAAVRAELSSAERPFERRAPLAALLAHPDPRAEAAVLNIYREMPEGDEKVALAMMFRQGKTAEAKAIGQAVCENHPQSKLCQQERESKALTARLRAQGLDVIDADSAPVAEDELEGEPERDPPAMIKAMSDRLVAMGFAGLAGHDPANVRHADPLSILADAGVVHGFDAETGQFPNEHDSLMRDLAGITGGAFAGAVFEEMPPVFDERTGEEEQGPYRLSVYLGGKRYRVDAKNNGDWYDVEAVLRLMNAVLADRRSELRLHAVGTADQTATVVAATPRAFAKAVKAGLLHGGDPQDAERAGKAFEESVLGKQ